MAANFRAVRVEWGENSSEFIKVEDVISILEGIAEKIGSSTQTCDIYENDCAEVWIDEGQNFLNALKTSTFEEFESWQTFETHVYEDLKALFDNMKALADGWHEQIDSNGELRFWLD